ncbi:MAG: hypothetical protein JNK82_41185 [Myxococcaceae bacterium]|nr:hypothetical protein [Myxococcaceae bacterium]
MSFVSCTFNDGVFALKLDFSFGRRKAVPPPKASKPAKPKKKLGARPLPPPFPLPPVNRQNDLLDAPLLADAPPPPTPSVIVDEKGLEPRPDQTLLMDDENDTRVADSPLESPKTDLMQQRRDVRRALRSG